jgi:WD40 repeat protein
MIWSVSISPSGDLVAAAGRYGRSHDGRVSIYAVLDGREVTSLLWPEAKFRAAAFDPSGTKLAAGDDRGRVVVWTLDERRQGEEIMTLAQVFSVPAEARDLAFSPDGSVLALACVDRVARLMDVAKGAVIAELSGHEDAVQAVAFSGDGRLLATAGGSDGTVRVWDPERATELTVLMHGLGRVTDVEFAAESSLIVAAYADLRSVDPRRRATAYDPVGAVRVWDVSTESIVRTIEPGRGLLKHVSVSLAPEGDLIAVSYGHAKSSLGNYVAIFDPDSENPLVSTLRGRWRAPVARWLPTGNHVLVVSGDSTEVWRVDEQATPVRVWEREWSWRDKVPRADVALPENTVPGPVSSQSQE